MMISFILCQEPISPREIAFKKKKQQQQTDTRFPEFAGKFLELNLTDSTVTR
jgi:hypothetical protein